MQNSGLQAPYSIWFGNELSQFEDVEAKKKHYLYQAPNSADSKRLLKIYVNNQKSSTFTRRKSRKWHN